MRLIVPVVARKSDRVEQVDGETVRVVKAKGTVTVRTDAAAGFGASCQEKAFKLVPGFEAFPFAVAPAAGKEARVRLQV